MVNPNILAAWGATPDSYFITYGRKMSWSGMAESLTKTFTTEVDMNPMSVGWLRTQPGTDNWAAMNRYNRKVWYGLSMAKELIDLVNVNRAGNRATSISWTSDGTGYFVRLTPIKEWTADLPDDFPHKFNELRASVKSFDIGLVTILFGHGTSHIYVFERGFSAHFYGAAEDPEHILHKTILEFNSPGWNMLEGSSLSPYDDRHFCLKFQKQDSNIIQMRWNLPPAMDKALKELQAIFNDPEEQAALARIESQTQSVEMIRAVGNMNTAVAWNRAVNRMWNNNYY